MGLIRAVIIAVVVVVVAYYAYNPLPKDIEQPISYSSFLSVNRIIEDLGKISQALGWKELVVFRRDMGALILSLSSKPVGDDIKVTTTLFGSVPVRVYQLATQTASSLGPGLAYVHGGGFVQGSASDYDAQMAQIVRDTGVVVMSIDYRLAPEHPSPAALQDCIAATSHFFTHAEDWGVDSGRIGIGGDSAGGNMAAVLAQRYRDMGGRPQFAYQVLIYPLTQVLNLSLPSHIENAVYNMPMLKPGGIALIVLKYLGVDAKYAHKLTLNQHVSKATQDKYASIMNVTDLGSEDDTDYTGEDHAVDEKLAALMLPLITDPYSYPLMADSVEGLPPVLIITAGYDTLRDDGLLYLRRLTKADVVTEHYHDAICWHAAFRFSLGQSVCGQRMLVRVIDYINQVEGGGARLVNK